MKIVIVNCAISQSSNEYSTMLTKDGFEQAERYANILEKLKPDIVYSSPFIRALQTIYPFCAKANIKVCAECSLSPKERYDGKEYYTTNESLGSLPPHFCYLLDIIDRDYSTQLLPSNILRNELASDIGNRVFPFLYGLKRQYLDSDKTILIVTHADICPYFLRYFAVSSGEDPIQAGSIYSIDIP